MTSREKDVARARLGAARIVELDVRRRFSVSVAAIRRGDRIFASLEGNEEIRRGDGAGNGG